MPGRPGATIPAPIVTLNVTVPEIWIDINGHMNSTRYGLVIYDAHVELTRIIGMGDDYVASTQCSKAVLESHMAFEREVALGDELEVRSWLLAVDHKRLHFFHELYNLTRAYRAATSEQVDIHIDLEGRRSTPFPEQLYTELQSRVRESLAVPQPLGVGGHLRPPLNDWLSGA